MRLMAGQAVPAHYSVEAAEEVKDLNELQYQAYSSCVSAVLSKVAL